MGQSMRARKTQMLTECEKDAVRKRQGVRVCGAVQVCAVLMLVCLMKQGEPVWEKFRSCVSGIGAGGLGKVFKYPYSQAWIYLSAYVS